MRLLLHAVLRIVAGTAPNAEEDPYARGLAAFEAGAYEEAATQFERAFEAAGDVALLYDWGQAERLAGHCDVAIELYDRFIADGGATTPDPKAIAPEAWAAMRDNARQQSAMCREQLETVAPPVGSDPTSEPPPPRVDAPVSDAEPTPRQPSPDRDRRPDALGVSLVAVGSAVAATGIGLLVGAEVRQRSARDERVHQDQRDGLQQASQLQVAGLVVLPAGVALAVGGAIRLALVARHRRRNTAIVPTGRGLVVRGRF